MDSKADIEILSVEEEPPKKSTRRKQKRNKKKSDDNGDAAQSKPSNSAWGGSGKKSFVDVIKSTSNSAQNENPNT